MYKTPSPATPDIIGMRPSRLGRFGVLPHLAGPSFLIIGLFARLPLAMLTVGALTLITTESASYAAGGFAAGAVGIGSALGAPLIGLLADKRGQRVVLRVSAALNTLAIAGLLTGALSVDVFSGGSLAVVLAASFLMGFTCPQIGPLARVRWMAMTRRGPRAQLDTALSYEGTADELTFVLGPALVGLLAGLIAPWLPLALAAVLTLAFVSAFAVHRTVAFSDAAVPSSPGADASITDPEVNDSRVTDGSITDGEATPRRGRTALVLLPVLGMIAIGTFFGATQTFLTAYAGEFGAAEISGLLYAVMGLSSAAAALSVAYWSPRFTHTARWIASAVGMVLAAAALVVPASIPTTLLVLFVLGVFVGPTMVTIFSIGSEVAPGHRLGTVMTLLASGIVTGTATGAAIAGSLAESVGASGAAVVPASAAVILLTLGIISSLVLRYAGRHVDNR